MLKRMARRVRKLSPRPCLALKKQRPTPHFAERANPASDLHQRFVWRFSRCR
jgi:hypothetical protein